jgi:hypothetical protein
VPTGALQLVAFDSCQTAMAGLRAAAKAAVGPYGFGGYGVAFDAGTGAEKRADGPAPPNAAGAPGAAPNPAQNAGQDAGKGDASGYSGTNNHEAGVEEPDLVKTDGRRIVTVSGGVLHVVDARSHQLTGELDLDGTGTGRARYLPADLLLAGDHALVLLRETYAWGAPGGAVPGGAVVDGPGVVPGDVPGKVPSREAQGPRLMLVDLAGGRPRLLSTFTIDGGLVDARQVGSIARVVIRSAPRLAFPYDAANKTDAQRLAANKAIIDRADADVWLPRWSLDTGGYHMTGRVNCAAVSRPAVYSGTSMLTVLTMDLAQDKLSSGDPVTVVADGQTVYGTGTSLYVASDQRWRAVPVPQAGGAGRKVPKVEARTELYKFDISGTGRPRYAAAGSVPGWLINQYALSEWRGDLRVAATDGQPWENTTVSQSSVYVLRQHGRVLEEVGHVGGLGKKERIYAVRFVGPLGYVVTFRQTDPLYTVDLHDPAHPTVVGELKITGYSAYLHPIDDTHLLGIGQEANANGRVQGTQVSLFDISNPAAPRRLAQYHVQFGHSEAEFDPHAFLYWPDASLLVVPLQVNGPPVAVDQAGGYVPNTGAMVLKVGEQGFTALGMVSHPWPRDGQHSGVIRRSLVAAGTLWTVSDAGLKASGMNALETQSWIPFA